MIQLTHIKKKETYKSKCYYFLSLQLWYLHNPNRKSNNVLSASLVLIFFFNISRKTSLLITFNIIFHNNTLWYLKLFTILSYINCSGCRCWDCLVSSYECNSHAVYFAAKYQRWELQVGRGPYNTVTINVEHGSEYELRKTALISLDVYCEHNGILWYNITYNMTITRAWYRSDYGLTNHGTRVLLTKIPCYIEVWP